MSGSWQPRWSKGAFSGTAYLCPPLHRVSHSSAGICLHRVVRGFKESGRRGQNQGQTLQKTLLVSYLLTSHEPKDTLGGVNIQSGSFQSHTSPGGMNAGRKGIVSFFKTYCADPNNSIEVRWYKKKYYRALHIHTYWDTDSEEEGGKTGGRNSNYLRHTDGTILLGESSNDLKWLLMKEKEKSAEAGLH